MHELDPDQERFAGLMDGMGAGFAEAISVVRCEIARFGLDIDGKFQIRQAEGRISLAPEPAVMPDNPFDHSGYLDGWKLGRGIGNRDGRLRIRQALVPFGLFLATDDRVTTVEVASALVAMARGRDRQHSLALLRDDRALHAFLDNADSVPPPAENEPSRDSNPTPTPASAASDQAAAPGGRFCRGWQMVKENVNRRTAIATLLGALTAGWFGLAPKSSPDKDRTDSATKGTVSTQSGYVPPTTWDNLPQAYRDQMLAWDQVAWTLEQAQNPSPVIATIVTAVMTQPTAMDHYKRQVAHFLRSSQRDGYWEEALICLNPQMSEASTRISMLSSIAYRIDNAGPNCLTTNAYQTILQLFQAGTEPDADVIALLDAVLTAGGIPH